MTVKIVFVSPNGTTRKTSVMIQEMLETKGHRVELIDIGRLPYRGDDKKIIQSLEEADVIGFGAPAYHMRMLEPMENLLSSLSKTTESFSFKAFLFLTYSGITSGKAFQLASRKLIEANIPVIGAFKVEAPHLHHTQVYPTNDTIQTVEAFCEGMKAKMYRPVDRLESIFKPRKILVRLLFPLTHLIGKLRELPISIDESNCVSCGKCSRECPAGAIRIEEKAIILKDKCIHCYHCPLACPAKAIHAPLEKLEQMIRINKKIVGMETPHNQIYF